MRYKAINNYAKKMIVEQAVPPTDPAAIPPADAAAPPTGDVPPPTGDVPPMPTDAAGGEPTLPETDTTEEVDVTDLVNMTKSIKKDLDSTKTEHDSVIGKMDDVFTKLSDLEQKLSQMDSIITKIDELGYKVEQMKPETPEEKLEMRSLDSYPFNQRPQEFFAQKQGEMRASGKNEYVLTKDDIQNYSPETIRQTFNPEEEDNEIKF